jgi:hypothetical protein
MPGIIANADAYAYAKNKAATVEIEGWESEEEGRTAASTLHSGHHPSRDGIDDMMIHRSE